MSDLPALDALSGQLLEDTAATLATAFGQMGWAEEQIDAAKDHHPDASDLLFHGFTLLQPTHRLMDTEFVYRGHCRELLDRLVHGEDTRPGTAAEICCLCCESSLHAVLTSSATGLYFRMWSTAFPDRLVAGDELPHYEALYGDRIEDLETTARHKLTVPDRMLDKVDCPGRHHGEPATCRFTGC